MARKALASLDMSVTSVRLRWSAVPRDMVRSGICFSVRLYASRSATYLVRVRVRVRVGLGLG